MIHKYKMILWKLLFCCCSGNHRQKFYYGHKEIMIPGLSNQKLSFANNIQRYFRFVYAVLFSHFKKCVRLNLINGNGDPSFCYALVVISVALC